VTKVNDEGPCCGDRVDRRSVRLGLLEHPTVETVADAVPEWLGQRLVRARDEPVDRRRDVTYDLGHLRISFG
jgi:hypothetical protein